MSSTPVSSRVRSKRLCAPAKVALGAMLGVGMLLPGALAAELAPRSFDIPAGEAAAMLKLFAAQSQAQLLYAPEDVRGMHTNEVRGTLDPLAALEVMLARTPLKPRRDSVTNAIAIVPRPPDSNAPSRPKPPHAAQSIFSALAGWFALAAAPSGVVAETADTAHLHSQSSDPNTEIVLLSPFEVRSDQDRGYRASGTLAGTRLRTDLRDVAASISVITKDMMDDLGANNLGTLLNYTLGTEIAGPAGNFSSAQGSSTFTDFDSITRNPNPSTRVRGLTSADLTRDFFLSDIPTDNYNTDRVDINRGPNSMLFGLGSPGGVVNSGLIKARTDRNKVTLSNRIDNWGTHREAFDANYALVPEKLAVRVAALYSDQRFRQKPAFVKDKRVFGTLVYKPFSSTTLRANTEWAQQDSNKPQSRPPFDSFTWWWRMGKPTFNPTTGQVTLLGTPENAALNARASTGGRNTALLNSTIGSWSTNVALVAENPGQLAFGITGLPAGVMGMEGFNERVRLTPSGSSLANDGMSSLQNSRPILQAINGGSASPLYNFWQDQQLSNPAVYDFYRKMLDGPSKYEYADWKTYNVTVEQQFFDGDAGIELAGDIQTMDYGYSNTLQNRSYALFIDINTVLPNGMTNPNFGRPVVSDYGSSRSNASDRRAGRATAYYAFDARKHLDGAWGRILGKHTLTVNYTDQERSAESFSARPTLLGLDYYTSEAATYNGGLDIADTNTRRQLARVIYLGPSVINAASATGNGIENLGANFLAQDMTSVNTLYYQSPLVGATTPTAWQYKTFSLIQGTKKDYRNVASYTTSRTRERFKSAVAILQSKWLDQHLVTTAGWRRDAFRTYDAGAAASDPATGLKLTDWNEFYPQLGLSDQEETFSYGAVAHIPSAWLRRLPGGVGLSLTYNESQNFRPTAQRFTVLNTPVPAQSGKTKEFGALLTLFADKIELRMAHYETTSLATTNSNLATVQNNLVREPDQMIEWISAGYNDDRPAAVKAWNDWLATPTAAQFLKTFGYAQATNPNGSVSVTHDDRLGTVVSTSDLVSKGYEFEAVVNPTRNWRLALNASRQEAVRSNTGRELEALMEQLAPVWTGAAGDLRRGFQSTDTLRAYTQTQIASLRKEVLLDGSATPELRRWRFNAMSNYSFSRGWLRGWSVGGAVRWQDKIVIGYPVYVDEIAGPQYDISKPFYGPTECNYDTWVGYSRKLKSRVNWKVQLNVRNVGTHDKLIPVSAQPDGSIAAWRIADPMTWTLTNTLEF